jgi:nucleoside-diphosphate-sugar epimerase
MNVLVTGATGFVGSHLVRTLGQRGDRCRCLMRPTSDRAKLDGIPNLEFVEGDITEPDTLEGIAEGCQLVYHLSAEGHVSAISEEAFQRFVRVNVEGTRNLLEECARRRSIERFVHFSSTAAMGLVRKPEVDEGDEPQPRTPYQRSKLESERAALAFADDGRVPVLVLRPCMIYGVGGRGEFGKWVRLMRKGIFPRVGLGRNLTPLVHVYDVVQAALLAGESGRPGETYLVASARSFPLAEIRRLILDACGVRRPYWYVPTPLMYAGAWMLERLAALRGTAPVVTVRNIANTVYDRVFSIGKARSELGYEPNIRIEDGIPETVRWLLGEDAAAKGSGEGT